MRNEILKVKIENIDEMRNWLIDRIATEDKLGNDYAEYREFDNGLMSTVHYQRAAAFRAVLTKLADIEAALNHNDSMIKLED